MAIASAIEENLSEQYYVEVETRTYQVKERYLEVRDISNHEVVTAIELLPPKNKQTGEGRSRYEKKRVDRDCCRLATIGA